MYKILFYKDSINICDWKGNGCCIVDLITVRSAGKKVRRQFKINVVPAVGLLN
jgi:hypothetical protein